MLVRNRQGISVMISVLMLMLLIVVLVASFGNWFNFFTSQTSTDLSGNIETETSRSEITSIIGEDLYVYNDLATNLEIQEVKINNVTCSLNSTSLMPGVDSLNISSCLTQFSDENVEITIISDKEIITKSVLISSSSLTSAIDCSALNGGEWIAVPGNPSLGTNDFCVMKYEAKFLDLSGKTQDGTYNGWRYDSATGDMNITSSPDNESITYITQIQARSACESLGSGYHLITNAQWTTIARNAENYASNWDSGTVGTGSIFGGHSDGTPNYVLSVSNTSDYWDQTGQSSPSVEKRTLILDNLEVIWDLGGNVWELNNDTCIQNSPWYTSGPIEWTNANLAGVNQEKDLAGPLGSYSSSENVGDYNGCSSNGNAFARGSHWFDTFGGIFSLSLGASPSYSGYNAGFRCAYEP